MKKEMILSQTQRYSLDCYETKLNNNVLVVGASGSGKTRHVVVPNLLQATGSYIISDPKGNLYKQYGPYLRKRGYTVECLDFTHPERSAQYNPYCYIRTQQDIIKLAHLFTTISATSTEDQFWDSSAELLFSALIAYQMECNIRDAKSLISLQTLLTGMDINENDPSQTNTVDGLMRCLEARDPKSFAVKQYKKFRVAAGRTLKSIIITANAKLGVYDTTEMRQMLSEGSLDLASVGQRKTAVFVVVSDTDRSMDPLANIFFTQAMQELCRYADDECDSTGNCLPVPVRFFLDDFATNVTIEDFPRMISSIRSRGISAMLMIQAESQLEATYGKEWRTIIGNCDTYLYLGGNDEDTALAISKRCDLPVTKILAMPVGECLIFRRGQSYVKDVLFTPPEQIITRKNAGKGR